MNWPAFALTLTVVATLVSWWAFQQSLRYSRAEIVWLGATIALVLVDAAIAGLAI